MVLILHFLLQELLFCDSKSAILLFNEFPSTIEVKEVKRFQGYKHTMLNEVFEAYVIDEIYKGDS